MALLYNPNCHACGWGLTQPATNDQAVAIDRVIDHVLSTGHQAAVHVRDEHVRCPDGGTCHHSCAASAGCWRRDKGGCAALTPSGEWPTPHRKVPRMPTDPDWEPFEGSGSLG